MIPVYKPWLTKLEKNYLNQTIDSGWISSQGKFVSQAEDLFAQFIGAKYCILTSSGTTALHLALLSVNLKPGAIVVPNITFAATAFAASYLKRKVRFVDVCPNTWNIDISKVEQICEKEEVSAIIPVHLYGNPIDMMSLLELQRRYDFVIIEDACEAIDAKIGDCRVGVFGDVGCFSFYANKTFCSSEGGGLVTNNPEVANRARLLRGQAQDPSRRYWHLEVGYNYRMTNMQAAILTAQLERADEILAEKYRVAERYLKHLEGLVRFQAILPQHHHSYWLISVETTKEFSVLAKHMRQNGVDVRPVFYPLTEMPPYYESINYTVSKQISKYGISLPSYPELTNNEIDKICQILESRLKKDKG